MTIGYAICDGNLSTHGGGWDWFGLLPPSEDQSVGTSRVELPVARMSGAAPGSSTWSKYRNEAFAVNEGRYVDERFESTLNVMVYSAPILAVGVDESPRTLWSPLAFVDASGTAYQSTLRRRFQLPRVGDTGSSTELPWPVADLEPLRRRLDEIITTARDEEFEFGIESSFEQDIAVYLTRFGLRGLDVMAATFSGLPTTNSPAIVRMIQAIGEHRDTTTHEYRFDFLAKLLNHTAASVRDAAALALYRLGSGLRNARTVRVLGDALSREVIPEYDIWSRSFLSRLEDAR